MIHTKLLFFLKCYLNFVQLLDFFQFNSNMDFQEMCWMISLWLHPRSLIWHFLWLTLELPLIPGTMSQGLAGVSERLWAWIHIHSNALMTKMPLNGCQVRIGKCTSQDSSLEFQAGVRTHCYVLYVLYITLLTIPQPATNLYKWLNE